jgi:hypothetical protein
VVFGGILPVWRGHAEFNWKLQPEVFRPNSKGGQYPEASLILTFMARAESRHQRCPDQTDRFEWLSLARHYVLPTRLMDWTASPVIALYFAVENNERDKKDGCLWALQASHMNRQMSGNHWLCSPEYWGVKQSVELAFSDPTSRAGLRVPPKALAVGPREIDYRMLAQQGVFTIHSDDDDLADVAYSNPPAGTDPPTPWRRAFRISANAKPKLREMLTALGIKKSTLFPDLGALAEELKDGSYGTPSPT